ncbi:MAG: helix-turn-helix domain protein [Bacteriophage sp.]|nr:MAG: helix-turn-helix domain protein [Bacteriophage sp.]
MNSKPIIVFILPTVKLFCSRFKNFVQINKMERIIMNTIDKIIQLLSEKKRTQKELTDSLGIEKSVFSAWKSGNSQSYKKYLPEIANFFDVSVGYLLGQEEKLDNVYLSLAKQAQDEGIDPDDIRLAIETIKAMKNK